MVQILRNLSSIESRPGTQIHTGQAGTTIIPPPLLSTVTTTSAMDVVGDECGGGGGGGGGEGRGKGTVDRLGEEGGNTVGGAPPTMSAMQYIMGSTQ